MISHLFAYVYRASAEHDDDYIFAGIAYHLGKLLLRLRQEKHLPVAMVKIIAGGSLYLLPLYGAVKSETKHGDIRFRCCCGSIAVHI